ncbi:MAG: hypothetical protein LBT09_00255 [Planctomycetaceae bacterium]|nr:hypothetical protein [Planctomycetaceae bacterium]
MNTDLNNNHNSDNIDIDHVKIGGGGRVLGQKTESFHFLVLLAVPRSCKIAFPDW